MRLPGDHVLARPTWGRSTCATASSSDWKGWTVVTTPTTSTVALPAGRLPSAPRFVILIAEVGGMGPWLLLHPWPPTPVPRPSVAPQVPDEGCPMANSDRWCFTW